VEIIDSEFVKLVYRASCRGDLKEYTPAGFKVDVNSHSTATHVNIYMVSKDNDSLKVWYKTNWVSASYEFNEKGKRKGVQNGCEFASDKIKFIYLQLIEREKVLSLEKDFESKTKEIIKETEYNNKVNFYKSLLVKNKYRE